MAQLYTVAQWRGTEGGYRILGRGLSEAAAIGRIALAERIWPERARAKAHAEELGETDTISLVRKYQ
jgi:hypothetical protein